MKKIGIVGYYGHGNFGDELFLHAFRRVFPANEFRLDLLGHSADLMRAYKDSRLDRIKETYGAIIIGGGDLLIPGYDVSDQYFLEDFLKVPVFIYGVGVPVWTGYDKVAFEKLKRYLQSESVRMICARDQQSVDWINSKLDPKISAEAVDDIVFSLKDTLEIKGRQKLVPRRVGIVMRGGQLTPKCKMKSFVKRLLDRGLSVRFLMLATGKELDYDMGAVAELECLHSPQVDVVVRQSDGDLLHAFMDVDVVYSMKFHGCIAALMHTIPTVALITTDKFRSLYKKLGLEKFVIHHTNEKLFESLDYFTEFPELDIDRLYESSTAGLAKLRVAVEAVI